MARVYCNPLVGNLKLRGECCVIAESLHLQRYKYLWDVLFKNHPKGERILGKWEGMGDIAGVLFMPYLGWVTFAGVLNFTIWRLNA